MNPYLELVRPNVVLLSVMGLVIGNSIVGFSMDLLPAVFAAACICGAGNVINDYFDMKNDALNKSKRPLPSGRIDKERARWYAASLYLLGLASASLVNTWFFLLALFNTMFSYNYAKQPKGGGLLSNFADSWLVASTFLAGGIVSLRITHPVVAVSLMAFMANTSREIFKDIEDMRGDSTTGLKTLPILFGKIKSRMVAQILVLGFLIFAVLVFVLGFLPKEYFIATIPAALIFVYASMKKSKKAQKLFKAGMYIGLISYLTASVV